MLLPGFLFSTRIIEWICRRSFLKNCDFSDKNYAYLYDRVAINSGEKQRYGTQFERDAEGKLTPKEIENEGEVDERRKEKGLESLSEHIKERRETDRFAESSKQKEE